MPGKRLPLEERFRDKYTPDPNTGCWLWTAVDNGKYGTIWSGGSRREGKIRYAHRVSYELFVGPIPEGLIVKHDCDVALCVNPDHLSVGTYHENAMEAVERLQVSRGERNGQSILTSAQVREIRRRRASGESVKLIAEEYEVGPHQVWQIATRRRWAWLD